MDGEQTEAYGDLVNRLSGCTKVLLTLASVAGLLGWIYVAIVTLGYFGFPKTLSDAFFTFYPFIYLPSAIYCSWVNIPRRMLIIAAVLLNLPLAAVIIYAIIGSDNFFPAIAVCLLFILLWALLCMARIYGDTPA